MSTVYPDAVDDWQDPVGTDALSTSPDGRTHAEHHSDLSDVALAMEAQLAGPAFTSSAAYADFTETAVHSADSLSDSIGVWTAVNTQAGDTPSLDSTNKTEGTASVTCDLKFPSGAGTTGALYVDLVTPLDVGSHTAATVDVRFHGGTSGASPGGFRIAVADGAGLTGNLVYSNLTQDSDSVNLWFTITVPLGSLTSVASMGIQKRPEQSGSSSKWNTWWLDNLLLREGTAVDAALVDVDGTIVVPSDYVATQEQFSDTYNVVRSVLDLRTAHATHPGINGTYNLRDWRLDETGVEDVTEDLQRIFDQMEDGTTLLAPSTGIFRLDDSVSLGADKRDITFDGQGSRWIQPLEINTPLFNLNGTQNVIKNVKGFSQGINGPNNGSVLASGDSTHPIVGTPTINGTGVELNDIDEQVELPWKASKEIAFYARDHLGVNTWDFVLSDSNHVANDCKFTIMEPDGTVLQTTTQTLTSTPTTYTVSYTPTDLYLPLRVAVSKATALTNTITLAEYTQYGRQTYDASLAFNHFVSVHGDSCVVRDCWAEGMGGDMVTTGGAQGLYIENVNGRVVGRQGFSFNTGQWITLKNSECVGASRHALDFEPESTGVFVSDITVEGCRFIDPGLGFIAATAWPHVRRVHMRNCDFRSTWGGTGPWFTGGWWEGTLENCSIIRGATGPYDPTEFTGRGVTISNITASGGILLNSSTRHDEGGVQPADTPSTANYISVNGWHAYDPVGDVFTSEITNYTSVDCVEIGGSYAESYPI